MIAKYSSHKILIRTKRQIYMENRALKASLP